MKTSINLNLSINGLDEVNRLSDELHQCIEKTKALAGALILACDELKVSITHNQVSHCVPKDEVILEFLRNLSEADGRAKHDSQKASIHSSENW